MRPRLLEGSSEGVDASRGLCGHETLLTRNIRRSRCLELLVTHSAADHKLLLTLHLQALVSSNPANTNRACIFRNIVRRRSDVSQPPF